MSDELMKLRDETWERYKENNEPQGGARFYMADNRQYWKDGFNACYQALQADIDLKDTRIDKLEKERSSYKTLNSMLGDNGEIIELQDQLTARDAQLAKLVEAIETYPCDQDFVTTGSLPGGTYIHNSTCRKCTALAEIKARGDV